MRSYDSYLDAYSRGVAAKMGPTADLAIPPVPDGRSSTRQRAAVALGLYDAARGGLPQPWAQVRAGLTMMLEPARPRATQTMALPAVPPRPRTSPGATTLMGDLPPGSTP